MATWFWIIIAIAAVVVFGVLVAAAVAQRRRVRLRRIYGPEYDRIIEARGNRREAERELEGRFQRRRQFQVRALSPASRDHYRTTWRSVQERFVDAPADAVREADTLVSAVMRERGYPVAEFDQRSADVSVDHPRVVENFRVAHGTAVRSAQGVASTEDLRAAMLHYRSMFAELVEEAAPEETPARA